MNRHERLIRRTNEQRTTVMAASAKLMVSEAERRFPVRIRIGVPAGGLGQRLDQMQA
jgi:hypothetical protein